MKAIRIEAPHFVAAVEIDAWGRVYRAAPIVRYMLRWDERAVVAYCFRKRWRVIELVAGK